MALEHEDNAHDHRDYTRYLWWGILAAVVLMIGLFAMVGERQPTRSEVHAKHILIKCNAGDPADRARGLKTIMEIRERLVKGENFEKLAKEFSNDDFSADRGGDLGFAPKGTYLEPFEVYAWSAPLNQLSDVVQTAHGFHLIVVVERYLSKSDAYEQELEKRVSEVGNETSAPASVAAPATPPVPAAPAAAPAAPPVAPAPAS
jgi:parvulin-like peptidyl-prolyl isomerase